jgi:predicted DNA binding CopG/RHH family protein
MRKIPEFSSEEREREFWAEEDSTEYFDWSKARRVTFPKLKPSTRTISLRLPEALLDQVRALANARDVPYQSLLKLLLAERVAEESKRPPGSYFWVTFAIGDVFPADSPLSAWIAGLSTIANDLLFVHEPLLSESEEAESARVYSFWLVCAQYREAARFIASGLKEASVISFNEQLDAEVNEMLEHLRRSFDPWEGSFVQTVAKPIRDRLFHYPNVGDPEWKGILSAHSNTRSGISFRGSRRVKDTRSLFADDLRAALLSHYLGMSEAEMGESMAELASLVGLLARVSHQSLGAYLQSVPPKSVRVVDVPPGAEWLEERFLGRSTEGSDGG